MPSERGPRLGIIHLLGWTLSCAAVLAVDRAISFRRELPLAYALELLGHSLAYGTAVGGLGIVISCWRTKRHLGPRQPGHLLLIFVGASWLVRLATYTVMILVDRHKIISQELAAYWHLFLRSLCLAVLGAYVFAPVRREPPRWLLVAAVIIVGVGLDALSSAASLAGIYVGLRGGWVMRASFYIRFLALGCYLLVTWSAVAWDYWNRRPRDWLHAAGVAAFSLLALTDLAMFCHSLIPR